jgi:hypothetical protein
MKHKVLTLFMLLTGPVAQAQFTITAVTPRANERAVARNSPLTITFNQSLATASATALKVFSPQRGGLRSRATTPVVVNGSVLRFAPTDYYFQPGETVQYTVTTAASGNSALTTPRVGQFTTAVGGTGVGLFPPVTGVIAGQGATYDAQLADVDGDSDLDILAVNSRTNAPGTVSVRLNDGTGTFNGTQEVAVGTAASSLVVGDVDGDGDLDFIAMNGIYNSISVRLNDGTGNFVHGQDLGIGGFPQGCALGDVDGDGDLDLAVANNSTTVDVLLNSGSGNFSLGTPVLVAGNSRHVALGDVDNDGDLDLLTALDNANAVSICLNNGLGIFLSTGSVAVGTNPYKLALGDLDGDGDLDLVTANSALSGTLSIRLNNGTGTLAGGGDLAVGPYPQGVALGDLDKDGDLDILAPSQSTATTAVRLNNGNATFSTRPDVAVGISPRNVSMGDVDGDGDLDFITAQSLTVGFGTVIIGLNGGAAPAPVPTLLSFSPTTGPVGTAVTLSGTDLTGTTAVKFNGVGATAFTVNAAGNQIMATVPMGATTGNISVTTPGGTASTTVPFTVLVSVPVVNSFSPTSGLVGTMVALTGTGLTGATSVTFNGVLATGLTVNSAGTQIIVNVPLGATTGNIRVTTPSGTATSTSAFTVLANPPVVSSFMPTSGVVGTTITVTGTNLTNTSAVTLNGVAPSAYTVVNATTLTFTVPVGATSGRIAVTTPSGTAASTSSFIVIIPNPTPTLVSLSPGTVAVGSRNFTLTLTGTEFRTSSAVVFNGTTLATTYVSTTQLTAQVPASAVAAVGSYDVTVRNPAPGGGSSAALPFVVTEPVPTISSFTPTSGGAGTLVTITGTNLTGATQVRIGSVLIPTFTVVSATNLTLVIPLTNGVIGGFITIMTPGGTATSATAFSVVLATTSQAQVPLAVYPNPFHSNLTVLAPGAGPVKVLLRDVTGRAVLPLTTLPASKVLDLPSGLVAGVYLLEIRQGDTTTMRRLLKQ